MKQHVCGVGVAALAVVMLLGVPVARAGEAVDFRVVVTGDDGSVLPVDEVEHVYIDDIIIGVREMTTGADRDYRVSGPGDAHFGSITIRARVGKSSNALNQWWLDCSQGKNIRKNISVIALKRDGSEARRFDFFECWPTAWKSPEESPDGRQVAIVCQINGLEMTSAEVDEEDAAGSDLVITYTGLEGEEQQEGWPGPWRGGETAVVRGGRLPGSQHHEATPGRLLVTDVTLRGPLTSGRKALCEWITATVKGQPWKRSVAITEVSPNGRFGRTFSYADVFPVRYVFPEFSKDKASGVATETIVCKMQRVELA